MNDLRPGDVLLYGMALAALMAKDRARREKSSTPRPKREATKAAQRYSLGALD